MISYRKIITAVILLIVFGILRIPVDVTTYDKNGKLVEEVNIKIIKSDANGIIEIIKNNGLEFLNFEKSKWINCRSFEGRLCGWDTGVAIDIKLTCGSELAFVIGPGGGKADLIAEHGILLIETRNEKEDFKSFPLDRYLIGCSYSFPLYHINKILNFDNSKNILSVDGQLIYDNNNKEKIDIYFIFKKIIYSNISSILKLYALSMCSIALMVIIGNCLLSSIDRRNGSKDIGHVVLTGFCAVALINNSLLYFISINHIILVLSCFVVGLVAIQSNFQFFLKTTKLLVIETFYPVLFIAVLISQPYLVVGDKALAFWQTDVNFYEGVSYLLKDNTFNNLNTLIGISHRSIDSAFSSLLSNIFDISVVNAWMILIILLLLINFNSILSIYKSINKSDVVPVPINLLALTSPVVVGVYYEGYLSQFFFTVIIWASVAVYFQLINVKDYLENLNITLILILALGFSTSFLSYPYFFIVFSLIIVLHYIATSRNIASIIIFKNIISVIIGVICFSNFGLQLIFNKHEADINFLNGIAENIVFPFMHSSKIIAINIGLIPFHSNYTYFEKYNDVGLYYFGYIKNLFELLSNRLVVSFISIWIGLNVFLKLKSGIRNPVFSFFVIFYCISILILLYLNFTKSWYGYAKFGWFVCAMMPLFIIYLVYQDDIKISLIKKISISIYTIAFVSSSLLASLYWFSGGAVKSGVHAANSYKVTQLINKIKEEHARAYYFIPSKIRNDSDMMIMSQVELILKNEGYRCMNCAFYPHGEFYWVSEDEKKTDGGAIKKFYLN